MDKDTVDSILKATVEELDRLLNAKNVLGDAMLLERRA